MMPVESEVPDREKSVPAVVESAMMFRTPVLLGDVKLPVPRMAAMPLVERAPAELEETESRLPVVRPVEEETIRRPTPVVSALAWMVWAQPVVMLLAFTMTAALLLLLAKSPV